MADSADIVIRVRTDGVGAADTALRRLETSGVRVETVSSKMENGFRKTAQSADAFHTSLTAVRTVMTATSVIAYVGALTKLSDAWLDVTNKLANANSANEKLATVQERVFGVAQRTRTSLDATATLYARMERSLNQYGVTGRQVAQVTETINKAMIVSGATSAESTAAIIQFSQGLQSGVLRGDEFRSVMEQAPRLGKLLADGLGVGTAGLRALANQGKLTADVVINAISKSAASIDEEYGRTIPTFSQRMALATNNVQKFAGTSQQVQGVINLLGEGIAGLSNNLGVLSTLIIGVTAVLGGKMLTAITSQISAYIQLNTLSASSSAIHIKTIDALTRTSVARYNDAQATLAQLSAERARINAALAANQQYYKGIATTNALMQNTRQVTEATVAAGAAQAVMSRQMGVAATASKVLTVSLTAMKATLGLVGGPVGLIMLAAAGWYMYSQNAKQAVTDSEALATSTDSLKDSLTEMTLAQQRALAVQLERASVTLTDKIEDEKVALQELNNQLYNARQAQANSTDGSWSYNKAIEAQSKLQGDIAIKTGEISGLQQKAAQVQDNLTTVNDNLRSAVMGLTGALQAQNSALNINISAAAGRSQALTKALQAQNNELDIAQYKLSGNEKAAAQLQDAQSRLGKVYTENKKFVDDYIAGHSDATAVLTDEQQGIVEFLNMSGKAYDAQKQLQDNLKDERNALKDARAFQTYGEQWNKAYERVEARGATSIERLRIQQEAEVRQITDKAEKAKATEEQLGQALLAIDAKYARLRADEAAKYKPGAEMVRQLQESQREIAQMQAGDLLTEDQANQAKLALAADYYEKRSAMRMALDPIGGGEDAQRAELDALQNQYNTAIEMAQGNEEQLTLIKQNYEQQRYDIQLKYAQMQAQAQSASTLNYIQSVSSMAGSMASILKDAGAEGSAAYKAMFALSKGFAIAQATLNLTTAISQAMADPAALSPMQKFANMAAVAAAGASLVSQITSASLTGMAHDGITEVPQEGTWLLQKGERVLSAQQNSDFTNYLQGNSTSSGGTSTGATIIQYITVSGAGDQALADAVQRATADGADQGYNRVLADTTSRGNISRSIGR